MTASRQCARCLVVADDSLTRWTLVQFLQRCCLDARSVGSGELALALLQEWPAEFLIADVRLPGMDGLKLAQRCQDLRHRPRIILTTGSELPPSPSDLGGLGVLGVIEKPFLLDRLTQLLDGVLREPGDVAA